MKYILPPLVCKLKKKLIKNILLIAVGKTHRNCSPKKTKARSQPKEVKHIEHKPQSIKS